MRFFDFFLRRIDGRRKASPGPDPCGALPAGPRHGRTRFSVTCLDSDLYTVRRRGHAVFLANGMSISRVEVRNDPDNELFHVCFTIDYQPHRRSVLMELAELVAADPLVVQARFGIQGMVAIEEVA